MNKRLAAVSGAALLLALLLAACSDDGDGDAGAEPTAPDAIAATPSPASAEPSPVEMPSPTPTATPTSSPPPAASTPVTKGDRLGDWTLAGPAPLPDGVSVVVGTGCWRCGGQYSTFELVSGDGRQVLRPLDEHEVHMDGDFSDPDRLTLAVCAGDCDGYTGTPNPDDFVTTLYESRDRGESWEPAGDLREMFAILGRELDGELLLRRFEPEPRGELRYPSGDVLDPPPGASESALVVMVDEPLWRFDDHTVVDAEGRVQADFSDLLPEGGSSGPVAWHETGGWLALWTDGGTDPTLAILGEHGGEVRDADPFLLADIRWLDGRYLIASMEFTEEEWASIGVDVEFAHGRHPTMVDLETWTLYPLEEFFEDGAPSFGRNTLEAVWVE